MERHDNSNKNYTLHQPQLIVLNTKPNYKLPTNNLNSSKLPLIVHFPNYLVPTLQDTSEAEFETTPRGHSHALRLIYFRLETEINCAEDTSGETKRGNFRD